MSRGYLRYRRAPLALLAVVCVLFPLTQWLYGQPMAPVGYALLMLAFLLVIVGAADYTRYARRVRALDDVLDNLSVAAHALPPANGPVEERYREIAGNLYTLLDEQAEKAARESGERIDYYTMWVHQIKTPIAAMRLALSAGASPQAIEAELFKVERYIEMALQYVKLSDLSADLVIREYDLRKIVSGCVKKYAPLFIGKHLRVDIEGDLGTVTTDSKWLSFILEQLLSNAIKYTERGGVRFAIEGGALLVEDSGIGIRAEDLPRIFEKGYTGFNGRMDQRASGLGLYMARRVADQLGIRIYPESSLRSGTKMLLVFPRRETMID